MSGFDVQMKEVIDRATTAMHASGKRRLEYSEIEDISRAIDELRHIIVYPSLMYNMIKYRFEEKDDLSYQVRGGEK